MIKCPNCGKEMPDGAKFCCFCASSMTSGDLIEYLQNAETKTEKEKSPKKKKINLKKVLLIIIPVIILSIVVVIGVAITPALKYNKAEKLCESGEYQAAIDILKTIIMYKDSQTFMDYNIALLHGKNGEFNDAVLKLGWLGDYRDAIEQIENLKAAEYNKAEGYLEAGEKAKAAISFGKADDYKDAKKRSFALWNDVAMRETISAGWNHTVAVKEDGKVVATGNNEDGQCNVSGWRDIVAVSAAGNETYGLKSDGTVVSTVNHNFTHSVSEWTDIVAISTYNYDSWFGHVLIVGLKCDGTLVSLEFNRNTADNYCFDSFPHPDIYDEAGGIIWQDLVAVFPTSNGSMIGVKVDGTIVVSPYDDFDTKKFNGIVSIYRGDNAVAALKSDGTIVVSDKDVYDGLSDWKNIISIDVCGDHIVGLKKDGTVVGAEEDVELDYYFYYGELEVGSWSDIVAVSTGLNHTIGLRSDGTVVATKYINNDYGGVSNSEYISEYITEADRQAISDAISGIESTYVGQCDVYGWTNIKLPKTYYAFR